MLRILSFCLVMVAGAAWADPSEPARGSDLRSALLDAVRVPVEAELGAPVEFVVNQLLAEGDRAIAFLDAQRPGGAAIDLSQTPLHLEQGVPLDLIDGPRVEAFLHLVNGSWQVVAHSVGATDAWAWGYDCANYAAFFPAELCGG